MLKGFKKLVSLVLVLVVSMVVSVPAFAEDVNLDAESTVIVEDNSNSNPLDSGKNILYYLFWTKDSKLKQDLSDLQTKLMLSDEQMNQLKTIGLNQFKENQRFKTNQLLNNALNKSYIKTYNAAIKTEAEDTNQAMKSVLNQDYSAFRDWIGKWWQNEKNYRNNLVLQNADDKFKVNANIKKHIIYATQYNPNTSGAREVALPDKYVKFANLGWDDTYSNPPYTVTIRSSAGTLSNVEVDDVGPWNENDNYWDSNRREFGDLTVGTPEAYAAYENNYNNGEDEFGRTVTNPAGIDLSPAAAKAIGLGTYESGWIEVTFSKLP